MPAKWQQLLILMFYVFVFGFEEKAVIRPPSARSVETSKDEEFCCAGQLAFIQYCYSMVFRLSEVFDQKQDI